MAYYVDGFPETIVKLYLVKDVTQQSLRTKQSPLEMLCCQMAVTTTLISINLHLL